MWLAIQKNSDYTASSERVGSSIPVRVIDDLNVHSALWMDNLIAFFSLGVRRLFKAFSNVNPVKRVVGHPGYFEMIKKQHDPLGRVHMRAG